MLKMAIFLDSSILFIISIFLMVSVFNRWGDFNKLKSLNIIYIIYSIVNFVILKSEIVEIDWDYIFLCPMSVVVIIMCVVNIYLINRKNRENDNIKRSKLKFEKFSMVVIAPVLIFIIPYVYELYIINNCTYLLKYNYQNGFVSSDDTYIAIINNKPVSVTLQKNFFSRNGISSDVLDYQIIYDDDIEIVGKDYLDGEFVIENEAIEKIALKVKEKHVSAKSAELKYFSEKKYALITLLSEENCGDVLGEYFYYNNKYIKISSNGNLELVTYFD